MALAIDACPTWGNLIYRINTTKLTGENIIDVLNDSNSSIEAYKLGRLIICTSDYGQSMFNYFIIFPYVSSNSSDYYTSISIFTSASTNIVFYKIIFDANLNSFTESAKLTVY